MIGSNIIIMTTKLADIIMCDYKQLKRIIWYLMWLMLIATYVCATGLVMTFKW